jgi:hypothetical protein
MINRAQLRRAEEDVLWNQRMAERELQLRTREQNVARREADVHVREIRVARREADLRAQSRGGKGPGTQ